MGSEDFSKDDYNIIDDEEVPLPGFRFHPTDEELVGFYLRRQLDKKPIRIELIKQIDIYKYDPWDLPKASSTGGEKEWYFFCRRGRKYRNSIRPNRVTGSGFWKATGIDKPVFSLVGEGNDCIGLKKTLVYYRGSAGKGTKTDWMMHEFRLPSIHDTIHTNLSKAKPKTDTTVAQEAEIWTLCRIFKRNVSPRKCTQDRRQVSAVKLHSMDRSTRISSSSSIVESDTDKESYINFGASNGHYYNYQKEEKPGINYTSFIDQRNQFHHVGHQMSSPVAQPQLTAPSSNFRINPSASGNDFLTFDNWDELGSVVKFAVDSPFT